MIYMTLTVYASYSWVAWHKCHAIQGVWVMSCILHVMVSHMLHTTFEWHPNTTLVRRMCVPLPCLYFCRSLISLSLSQFNFILRGFIGMGNTWFGSGLWQRGMLAEAPSDTRSQSGWAVPSSPLPSPFQHNQGLWDTCQWWDSLFHC
jgi:hypothetical protein